MNKYEEPNVKVVRFNNESDVLTVSGERGLEWDSTWLDDGDFN
ncbi:MAG: hypothetical protein SOX77_03275 [Candidatus Borkfalkiaceae bacterium]|nr:hypothetical protein [Christensenellaceae bacterium]